MPRSRRRSRALVAVVITLAGCGGGSASSSGSALDPLVTPPANPPAPTPIVEAPPLEPGDVIAHRRATSCELTRASDRAHPVDLGGCPDGVALGYQLRRSPPGTCFVDAIEACPPRQPPAPPCNPPSPRIVECPAGSSPNPP